ncbi:3-isopropylmalate dehydratase, small subunit [Caulobacter sp. AP07]|uniref:3-isopropylmalate dehydratase small subunit n=1 Tax=Caulobacter sp. AP07 TaxID=1144304 RepID=UPI0002720C50|nr:3-isopropylmalate dehydratase small subunit [Caulobacter sp. AP07]EJL27325.1 3-isopropylmalate dehydratase, small subunit [Caulobacter sp. AP07]
MKAVSIVAGVAAPLNRADIDTDAIIPQNWLITTEREGLGRGLFSNWRYLPGTEVPDPAFVLNQPAFAGARILVAGPNYGCGSSREHAVWAHLDFGIEAVVAASFGPIFRDNALKNGLLTAEVEADVAADMLAHLQTRSPRTMTIDLADTQLVGPDGRRHGFRIDPERRNALLEGRDDIASTLDRSQVISAFQRRDRQRRPWIWGQSS